HHQPTLSPYTTLFRSTLIASRQGYNMTYLSLEWSSKSSSDQRAGRTGRTNHGQVFRLIPNHFYQTLNKYEIPEFEKTPLENYVRSEEHTSELQSRFDL